MINIFYILCIILIVILLNNNSVENYKDEIPKNIWSFWDNPELPEIVINCQKNWKKFAPNYKIKLLNKNNIENYVNMPENWQKLPSYRQADVLRLKLLEKYGGIWMDASILLLDNPDNFVGGNITLFTTPTTNLDNPVYENWFIASTADNEIIKKWINEVLTALQNDKEYIASSSDYNNNLVMDSTYLICHLALRNIYDKNKNLFINGIYYNSIDTAFYEHNKYEWKDIRNNVFKNFDFNPKRLIIKLRGCDRDNDLKIPNILL